jgi:hypothetical protein
MTDLLNPPTVEPTNDWLSSRRAHLLSAVETQAPTRRGFRWNWRVAAIVVAVLLFAGAAVAATGYTFFDWLRSDEPGAARFSIDPARTVDWPAPQALTCANPGTDFTCSEGSSGRWVYESLSRVESPGPPVSRDRLLAAVEAGEREGRIAPETAARLRAEIAAVGDEFFEKLNILLTFQSVASPRGSRPGYVLVPPAGVPQFVTCEPDGGEFRCRTLSAATDVPVGAPMYGLRENPEWIERAQSTGTPEAEALYESVFGRPLTPAEQRLLITLATPAASGGGGSEGVTTSGG